MVPHTSFDAEAAQTSCRVFESPQGYQEPVRCREWPTGTWTHGTYARERAAADHQCPVPGTFGARLATNWPMLQARPALPLPEAG